MKNLKDLINIKPLEILILFLFDHKFLPRLFFTDLLDVFGFKNQTENIV